MSQRCGKAKFPADPLAESRPTQTEAPNRKVSIEEYFRPDCLTIGRFATEGNPSALHFAREAAILFPSRAGMRGKEKWHDPSSEGGMTKTWPSNDLLHEAGADAQANVNRLETAIEGAGLELSTQSTGQIKSAGSADVRAQNQPPYLPSHPPAVPGNLSQSKEERMDSASAACTAAADCIFCLWDFLSLRSSDFLLLPDAPPARRPVTRRFMSRVGI